MTTAARVRSALVGLVLAVVGLSGCVQVPTAGPIKRVEGQSETCQNCINVEVAPPATGDDPSQVVRGYLQASWDYQPNYTTAKQFLTESAADSWRPDTGVAIYDDETPVVEGNNVRLTGRLVGAVEEDRTFTAKDEKFEWDFRVVQENGEWRISRPPPGLMVSKFAFDRFYLGYSTYFIGNTTSLVPERIYLPTLRNPDNLASALMTALLDGPSSWLDPAVDTAIPMGASPGVSSVTINNTVAEVPLNDTVLALSDAERSLLAAQIAYTLRQIPAVKGILITVDQQKLRVPGADPGSQVVPVEAFSREIDPVPFVTDQLYAVRDGLVYLVTDPNGTAALEPVPGVLGQKNRFLVDSLALSVNGTDLAVVTDRRSVLRRVNTASGDPALLTDRLDRLLRPQFTRYGEVWAAGHRDGKQRFWSSSLDPDEYVQTSVLDEGDLTAFRVSPDGTRIALVRKTPTGTELGLAQIARGNRVSIDGWRPIRVTQSGSAPIREIADVAWLDANELIVLGAATDGAPPTAFRVTADASRVTEERGAPADWNASDLTVLSRPQTVLVIEPGNQTWRRNGGQWIPLLTGVSRVAYAG